MTDPPSRGSLSDLTGDDGNFKPRKGGKIPHPPGRDEPLSVLRRWLSHAAGLPPEVQIETVIRHGQEPDDPITIILTNGLKMRCSHQSQLQSAKSLGHFLSSKSDGIAIPPYLSPPEVLDFNTALHRMSVATAHADPVADLHERLVTFVGLCEPVSGTLGADRFTTIEMLRARPAFDRAAVEGRTPSQPAILLDDGHRYIRASEWVTWLRGQGQTVNESGLVARMAEIDSERIDPQAWNSDRSRKVHLVFYTVPNDV